MWFCLCSRLGKPDDIAECQCCGDTQLASLLRASITAKRAAIEHDPAGLLPADPGAKLDAGKPRAWLFMSGFSRALAEVAKVTTFGAAKYSPNGWGQVPNGAERYMDAFARHALALGAGETQDADSRCLHKAQMIWNLLASLELELRTETE